MRPTPEKPGPGQESVWDYPRPPALETTDRRIRVELDGHVIADTTRAWRILETSHPPTYYIPPDDICFDLLVPEGGGGGSVCEWKGRARYYTARVDGREIERVAWSYPSPVERFAALKDHLAFYASKLTCWVDDERARPQEGGFYGGWITSHVAGPFKGPPGTWGW